LDPDEELALERERDPEERLFGFAELPEPRLLPLDLEPLERLLLLDRELRWAILAFPVELCWWGFLLVLLACLLGRFRNVADLLADLPDALCRGSDRIEVDLAQVDRRSAHLLERVARLVILASQRQTTRNAGQDRARGDQWCLGL
jgi:hypothetical protein